MGLRRVCERSVRVDVTGSDAGGMMESVTANRTRHNVAHGDVHLFLSVSV